MRPGDDVALVRRLFDAFNRRDQSGIAALCDESIEFFSIRGDPFDRTTAHLGPEGLGDYLAELARTWEELLMTPCEVERRGDRLLVRGRVYVRSHELGIRDMPAAWIWELRDGRFVGGEAFADPEEAVARFAGAPA